MIFRATYDDDGEVTSVLVDQFDLEMTWGEWQLHDEPYLKATEKRVTVHASGYIAVYDIVKARECEVTTRLRSVRRVNG